MSCRLQRTPIAYLVLVGQRQAASTPVSHRLAEAVRKVPHHAPGGCAFAGCVFENLLDVHIDLPEK